MESIAYFTAALIPVAYGAHPLIYMATAADLAIAAQVITFHSQLVRTLFVTDGNTRRSDMMALAHPVRDHMLIVSGLVIRVWFEYLHNYSSVCRYSPCKL